MATKKDDAKKTKLPATATPVTTQADKKAVKAAKPARIPKTDTPVTTQGDDTPPMPRAVGMITVQGTGVRYVGQSPSAEKNPMTPTGLPMSDFMHIFTPLQFIPFDRGIQVKDPKTGEFYYPSPDCDSWESCELNGSKLL